AGRARSSRSVAGGAAAGGSAAGRSVAGGTVVGGTVVVGSVVVVAGSAVVAVSRANVLVLENASTVGGAGALEVRAQPAISTSPVRTMATAAARARSHLRSARSVVPSPRLATRSASDVTGRTRPGCHEDGGFAIHSTPARRPDNAGVSTCRLQGQTCDGGSRYVGFGSAGVSSQPTGRAGTA